MQSSLTSYFKTKKRMRDEVASQKSSAPKLLALASPTPATQERSSSPSTPTSHAGRELFPRLESPIPVPAQLQLSSETESEPPTTPGKSSPSPSTPANRAGRELFPRLESPIPVPAQVSSETESEPPATPEKSSPSPSTPANRARRKLFPSLASPIPFPVQLSSEPKSGSSTDAAKSQVKRIATVPSSRSLESQLQLPYKFKMLEELFHALETVTSIFHSRNETITFDKVKPGVHEIMRRVPLKERHVEQMLAIFPDAYTVELDKLTTKNMSGAQKITYQLIIRINLECTSHIADTLTPAVATERRRIFRENLLKICHKHHQEFLSTLLSPIKIPAGKKVTRWHPRFRLDEVPDIQPEKKLPQAPEAPASANNAKEVIKRAQHILDNANPRMKKALAQLLNAKTAQGQKEASSALPSSSAPVIAQKQDKETKETLAALKGVSQSLIDKIRAREQEKAIRAMTLTPAESKNKVMMNRLPEFVKSVRNILVAEKKSVISLRLLVERLCHSKDGSLTRHEIEDHVRLLCRVLPTWASILKLSQGEFVKINKDANINYLLEDFSERLKNSN